MACAGHADDGEGAAGSLAGDRDSLTLLLPDQSIELLNQQVQLESSTLCGRTCQRAYLAPTAVSSVGGA